jgi:cytochrome b561
MATLAPPTSPAIPESPSGCTGSSPLLIVVNLLLGFFHEDFDKPVRAAMMSVHKATGFTILVLTLARIAWRLGPPAAALRSGDEGVGGRSRA